MARSLARNTKVYASTLTRANLTTVNMTTANTFELKVLDGYSYSQDTASQDVGVNEAASEAGCAGSTGIARGTQTFNTALNPVDVSFSTYVRPYQNAGNGDCVERILWSSAMGTLTGFTNSPSGTPPVVSAGATYSQDGTNMTFGLNTSNTSGLLELTLCFVLENATYVVEQFNVGSAEVDFSIDGIATINWSGNGSRVNEDQRIHSILKTGGTATEGIDYLGVPATTTTTFLRNKLSTLEIQNNELPTPDVALVDASSIAGTLINVNNLLVLNAHNGTTIHNITLDQFDQIVSNTTGTVTTLNDNDTLYSWLDTHDYAIYPMLTMSDATIDTTLKTVTDAGVSLTVDAYAGGRITKIGTTETATILSNTATVITLGENVPTGWVNTNDFILFTEDQQGYITYCIPITGASLTLENNITYLTPEELAIVNLPLAGFAGNRITSGSFTAYLNTGAQGSGGLLADLLSKIEASVSTNYHLTFHMGNDSTQLPRVDFDIPHASISIPTTNVEDIISTEISFTAKPWDDTNNVASFEDTNEMTITYASQ